MLKINMEYRRGVLFVRLKGKLTKYTYKSLENYLIPLINKYGIKYLVYNLEAITLIDNEGEASLKKGVKAVQFNQGDGGLCHAKSSLSHEFKIFDNELTAITKLQI